MPTPMRSDQVHISGMAARAARLAKEYHCGYEITAFSYAPMLEDAAAFPAWRRNVRKLARSGCMRRLPS